MNDIELVKAEDVRSDGRLSTKGRRSLNKDKRMRISDKDTWAYRLAEERNRRLELVHGGFSVDDAKEIARKERNEGKMKVEKRVICGKARTCEIVAGKINKVYDSNSKIWMSYDKFLESHGEYVEKVEKKVEEKVEEEKDVKAVMDSQLAEPTTSAKIEVPKITINTTGAISRSGSSVDYKYPVAVKVDSSKVSSDMVKITNEGKKKRTDQSIIDEYMELLYGW